MGLIKDFRLYRLFSRFQSILTEAVPLKFKITQIATLLVTLAGVIGAPQLANHWLAGHATLYSSLVALAVVLHAVLPSVFTGAPSRTGNPGIRVKMLLPLLLVLPLASARAQVHRPAQLHPQPFAMPVNLYAAGLAFNPSSPVKIAGTALYARQVNGADTYAFTIFQAVPIANHPGNVTTNVGAGIAQRIATIGAVPIYLPTSAGISWTGTNTGFQWSSGAAAVFHLHKSLYLLPEVGFLKSAVSNGSGYQITGGLQLAWGQ